MERIASRPSAQQKLAPSEVRSDPDQPERTLIDAVSPSKSMALCVASGGLEQATKRESARVMLLVEAAKGHLTSSVYRPTETRSEHCRTESYPGNSQRRTGGFPRCNLTILQNIC
jgi:hypothetical protein